MLTDKQKERIKAIAEYNDLNGIRISDLLIEEMAELTQAILKDRREESIEHMAHIIEELADVIIVYEEFMCSFPPFRKAVNKYIDDKLERTEGRINERSRSK